MKAHQILTIARNASRAMAISTHIGASLSINAGQYLYTFKDGSALLINGQAMRAFSTADDAINQPPRPRTANTEDKTMTATNIKIIKDPRQTGSFHFGTIMVGDRKVGTCHLECLNPDVDLVWDDEYGQPLIVTLLPKLDKYDHIDLDKWVAKGIKAGAFPVYSA